MAYFQSRQFPNNPKRSNEDYVALPRSELVSHYKTEITKKPGNKLSNFFRSALWSWIYHYIKSRFGPKFPYPSYIFPDTGIYDLASPGELPLEIKMAFTSDWATDTPDSFAIADEIKKHDPAYTIHIGDTYFVGAPIEIGSNFNDDGSPWWRGNSGSFAVLGNHEMYARGDAFFECLLPTLGIKDLNGAYSGQKAGYFCLQNKYWRVIGLDTGYHSTGLPLLEFLPFLAPDCRFNEKLMEWLENTVKLGDPLDKRGIVVLTHHQFITAFNKESEYPIPAGQLSSLIGSEKSILWLWGHEHKLAFYEKTQVKNGISVYGRCMGHGGMPVAIRGKHFKTSSGKKGYSKLVAVDERSQKTIKKTVVGYNGYVVVKMKNDQLIIEYFDNKSYLLSESWTADLNSGNINGKINVPEGCKLSLQPGKLWDDAVK